MSSNKQLLTNYQDSPEGRVAAIEQSMLSVIAAETTQQLLERMPHTTNKVLAQNDEGWTLQEPQTFSDLNAMGEMMGNCWMKGNNGWEHAYCNHPEWPKFNRGAQTYEYEGVPDYEASIPDEFGDPVANPEHPAFNFLNMRLRLPYPEMYRTLHDPNGVPRLAYDSENDELLGRHNSIPKDEYRNIWDELHENYDG